MSLPEQLHLKNDEPPPAETLKTALKTPLKTDPVVSCRNACQAIVSYSRTVFKEEPLLRSAAHTLCNYIYEQTPNYQLRSAGATTAGGVSSAVGEQT